ncbi:hypothetical protein MYFR107205_05125 [Mycolicibacterium frederiksbergense]
MASVSTARGLAWLNSRSSRHRFTYPVSAETQSSTAAAEAREISVSGGPLRGSTVDSAVAAAVLGGGAGVKRDGAGLDQRLRIEELASDRLRRYQRGRVVQE